MRLIQEHSLDDIAEELGRSKSTISRERKRNRRLGEQRYMAAAADTLAARRRHQARRKRKLSNGVVWQEVVSLLRRQWSPEQIAATLAKRHPNEPERRVSHETIYAALYILPRGELRKELLSHLRQHRKQRRPRSRGQDRRGAIPNMVNIAQRPEEIEERLVPGHWEGDLIKGANNASSVGTLVERHSRYLQLVKLDEATAESVCNGFAKKFEKLSAPMRKSMTYDQGREMAGHERLAQKAKVKIYFADPHSPWQRGSNENTNGLLRQYLPKGTDLSKFTQRELNAIAQRLNTRPRKTLNWQTPIEAFQQAERVALDT